MIKLLPINYSASLFLPIIILVIVSCKGNRNSISNGKKVDTGVITHSDSIIWKVTAYNLSEDMSVLSTQNDEILIFVYELNENKSNLDKPLAVQSFTLTKEKNTKIFTTNRVVFLGKKLLFVLFEQDSENTINQIDNAFRTNYTQIINEFKSKNYSGLEELIGDDDLLGVRIINNFQCTGKIDFNFNRVYKLDRYDYRIEIIC
jgi:hypothetical protein